MDRHIRITPRHMSGVWQRRLIVVTLGLSVTSGLTAQTLDGRLESLQEQRVRTAAIEIGKTVDALHTIPGAFPAVAAVIVQGKHTPLMHVRGRAHADQSDLVDRHSRLYIASQTKSFTALLAAHLHETGVLPLDTTLADIWPRLKLDAPADPDRITMADLLSHQSRLKTDTLNVLTAFVRNVPASDYPRMLSQYTDSIDETFRYANLGHLVYGAALEVRTGKTWKAWLKHVVLQPLKLDEIDSQSSVIPRHHQTWTHRWDGHVWIAYPPKPDDLMHAAGGLYASPSDMATWMRANLRPDSRSSAPSRQSFRRAHRPLAQATLSDGEFVCDGYSLGWYACTYRSTPVLMHPGSYTGTVSVTLLLPEMETGLSIVVNSDSAMERVQLELMKAFIGLSTGHDDEVQRLHDLVAGYPERFAKTLEARQEAIRQVRRDNIWRGWPWKPAHASLKPYAGTFHNDRLGELSVMLEPDGLKAQLGAMRVILTPATPHLFGASRSRLDAPERFRFVEDNRSLRWNDDVFVRQ